MENEPFSMRSRNEGGHVPKGLGEVVGGGMRAGQDAYFPFWGQLGLGIVVEGRAEVGTTEHEPAAVQSSAIAEHEHLQPDHSDASAPVRPPKQEQENASTEITDGSRQDSGYCAPYQPIGLRRQWAESTVAIRPFRT
jgi:hypothetical protein